ncbi:MAG: hypothetical protein AAB872_00765 [Patescibacteria group bacterium]
MKNKIILIICLITLLSVFIIFYLIKKNPSSEVALQGVVKPNIPSYVYYDGLIDVNFKKTEFNFPSKLPILKLSKLAEMNQVEALKIAENLGFDEDFLTFDDSEFGKTYLWNKKEIGSLILYSKSNNIVFTPYNSKNTSDFEISEANIKRAATNYLDSINILDKNTQLITSVYGLSTEDESSNIVNLNEAVVFKVVFSLNIDGINIVTVNPYESLISVYINKSGQIIKVEYSKTYEINPTEQEYEIKNYDDFITSIKEIKIINIDDGKILPQDIKTEDIKNLNITDIKISYLKESYKADILQPIFVITAQISLKTNKYNGILYLSAFK